MFLIEIMDHRFLSTIIALSIAVFSLVVILIRYLLRRKDKADS